MKNDEPELGALGKLRIEVRGRNSANGCCLENLVISKRPSELI